MLSSIEPTSQKRENEKKETAQAENGKRAGKKL
jgi:hypothetical protein